MKKLAYLVNQYPKVSHTFVRREIHALEALGHTVVRVSVRDTRHEAKDSADIAEAKLTHVLLHKSVGGALRLAGALLAVAFLNPVRMARALVDAVRFARRSDRGLFAHFAYVAEASALLRLVRAEAVEHVHAHFGTNSATVAALVRTLGGPPFSFTAHGPEEFDKPDLIALDVKIARAAFVVGVSSFGRSQLMRRAPFALWQRILVVPCGVDDSFLGEGFLAPMPTAPRLACVGRICEQKGQLLLLAAAARLHKAGVPFELVLVGDGEMRAEADALIHSEGLTGVVRITGWATGEVVRQELNAARAMVLPSFAEGLPVVIMEALALQRPVISTYVAGIPELVEPGACGWLVPAGSVDALVDAMRAAVTAPVDVLRRYGAEGRARVLARHDARVAARALSAAFEAAR